MQAHQGDLDDAFRKAFINLMGDLSGLPAAQINRTITGTKALAEGETETRRPSCLASRASIRVRVPVSSRDSLAAFLRGLPA